MLTYLMNLLSNVREDEEGQTMVEYSLILALVSVVAIAILGTLGTNVITVFTNAANALV
jgi:pilus assembly protein Flp/PilA